MKVTKATKSQTNQLNIQTGDFYDGTHALQVRISGEVVYRSLKDGKYKGSKTPCIGLNVPTGQEANVTKPICTAFNSHCGTAWTSDEILPLTTRTERNGLVDTTNKTLYLTTLVQPELFDKLGNPLESILDIPVGAKVEATFLMYCYNRSDTGELAPWKDLVSVKICEMPVRRKKFIPCEPAPEEETQAVTEDLEVLD